MENSFFALQDVPGKGKGLVATETIPKGTRILCERPLVRVPRNKPESKQLVESIHQQIHALNDLQRQTFLSLRNIHEGRTSSEQYMGIIRTNGLPIGVDGLDAGIFVHACRINHACDNNAQKSWNENIQCHTVHALRDIHKGEEITIFYLRVAESRKQRQAALQEQFHFTCCCRLCSLDPALSHKSDQRLEEILKLDKLIGGGGLDAILSSPLQILRYVDQQVQLYEQQGLGDAGLSRAFLDAAQIVIAHGDLARGKVFAERAVSTWLVMLGDDSEEVVQYGQWSKDPSHIHLYGMSMKWRTAVSETPAGLDLNAFEDWLWRRKKTTKKKPKKKFSHQLKADTNREAFPSFKDLPNEKQNDTGSHMAGDVLNPLPLESWCILGEIVEVRAFPNLCMELKDVDGTTFPVYFHTERRGVELVSGLAQKGHTVAILLARRHIFVSGEVGIRHEKPQLLKVFPVPLTRLLALKQHVCQSTAGADGSRTCHGCGTTSASLKRCGKCRASWYCNASCQSAGWSKNGHKADCKYLQDPDLRGLATLNCTNFDGNIQFPLSTAESSEICSPEANPQAKVLALQASTEGLTKQASELALSSDKKVTEMIEKQYAVRALSGRGLGLVATTKIAKGTRILAESPLFKVPRDEHSFQAVESVVSQNVQRLSGREKEEFFALHNIYGSEHSIAMGISRTNALPLGSNASEGGLFLEASRINHSCKHNAQNTWNSNLHKITIHAFKNIEEGEEITISYLDGSECYAARQARLKAAFKFVCACELCLQPVAYRQQSDDRLGRITKLDQQIGDGVRIVSTPLKCLGDAHTLFRLLEEEDIFDARVPRLYYDALQIVIANGDEARAKVFAEKANAAWVVLQGEDGPDTLRLKQYAEDPKTHRLYGYTMKWKQVASKIPRNLDPRELENWLWKKK